MKFFFDSSEYNNAKLAKEKFIKVYGQTTPENANIIVPIGGDGFLLKLLHDLKQFNKPFYGINYGSIGFLMNSKNEEDLEKIISNAQKIELKPLKMKAKNNKEEIFLSIAFNEISLMRQTHQAAKISIKINDIERMNELICDGVLVSTPAGSTAYNLSISGPILSLNSKKLAITPISPFRPRRWKGKVVSSSSVIKIKNLNVQKRSVSVVADNVEVRNIRNVEIKINHLIKFKLLYDKNYSLTKKIKLEQLRNK